ncbi:hypothetical protein D8I24_4102 (plasmid) [Cupriavidus necator H850]|nr:hypothetical protein D8I24_4102 [Cupriavidus necator H850]
MRSFYAIAFVDYCIPAAFESSAILIDVKLVRSKDPSARTDCGNWTI